LNTRGIQTGKDLPHTQRFYKCRTEYDRAGDVIA